MPRAVRAKSACRREPTCSRVRWLSPARRGWSCRGGYAGDGETRSTSETVITRDSGVYMRLMQIASSTVILDSLVFTGGSMDGATLEGMGLYASASDLTLTNCVVANNRRERNSTTFRGAGLYASGGRLTVVDSLFTNNLARGWSDRANAYGGAIYTAGVAVDIARTAFDNNRSSARYLSIQGGAIYMTGGSAVIRDALFTTNSVIKQENYSKDAGRGGAIYAQNLSSLDLADCLFIGNCNNELNGRGGTIFLTGTSQRTRMTRCVFSGNGARAGSAATDSGSIYLLSGYLYMTNVLHASNLRGHSLEVAGGTAEAVNCTFAGNANGYGIVQTAGSLSLRNCIVWGNASGGYRYSGGTPGSFNYCLLQEPQDGIGNATDDPLFADTVYYHVKSAAGNYTGGWFSGGTWQTSDATSPAIDAGDPSMAWSDEPQPNYERVNIGYDANTPAASKSVLGEPAFFDSLAVYTYPATNITVQSAWLRGVVAHTGGAEDPDVYLVWGSIDHGTDGLEAWQPNVIPLGPQSPWNVFSAHISAWPSADRLFYRVYATNSTGSVWSQPGASFPVPALPTMSFTGTTHVTRHAARIYGTLDSDGDSPTTISLRWWPEDDEEQASSVVYNLGQPVAAGTSFTIFVSGLSAGTNYVYSLDAINSAGTRSATGSFTTMTTNPISRYVSPTGAGIADGSNWANAYSNLQEAVDVCLYAGDVIYMQSGTYRFFGLDSPSDPSQCAIVGAAGLTIRGGYVGAGEPGARSEVPTVLARDTDALPNPNRRILRVDSSTIALDFIVIEDGRLASGGSEGAGARFLNSQALLTNCVLRGNGMGDYGGAIWASGGSLTLIDCVLSNNYLQTSSDNSRKEGGAIWAGGVNLRLERCRFVNNYLQNPYHHAHGGALRLSGGGQAVIADCQFLTNTVVMHVTHKTTAAHGGTIYASGLNRLDIRDCYFAGSYQQGVSGRGGAVYLEGANMKTTLTRCVFVDNGQAGHSGSLYLLNGTLNATNLLFAGTGVGNAVDIRGGSATLVNATFADNADWGVLATAGSVAVHNSIAWGNGLGGLNGVTAAYTCSQEALEGEGNFVDDPLFADEIYYHLSSRTGYLADGFFDGVTWRRGKTNSPCIDAGDSAAPYDLEPVPHGKRLNLGAYGNTPAASHTYRPEYTLLIIR